MAVAGVTHCAHAVGSALRTPRSRPRRNHEETQSSRHAFSSTNQTVHFGSHTLVTGHTCVRRVSSLLSRARKHTYTQSSNHAWSCIYTRCTVAARSKSFGARASRSRDESEC
ncbi:uncharacterized protein LOC143143188 [Ptiloglossa arizonensis]|uniref:uncharacterized protein LOC143143188 n=1 Tax=Ptiloglossa arizonensis TaxID=3350558 RepID=UPI003F9F13A9